MEYLKFKVSKVNNPALLESSRTLVRALARDGLMEDGKEQLLEGSFQLWNLQTVTYIIAFKAGRLKSACDLVCQYAPKNVRTALLASYE